MNRKPLTIAVTGLNATDNPAPGVGVLRSLALAGRAGQRLIGLAYDALDPGIYATDLADEVFLLPYPSCGTDSFLSRLAAIHERSQIDVIIPTLDAELPTFISIEPELRAMGIRMALPTRHQLDLRSKANLATLGAKAKLDVPKTVTVSSLQDLQHIHHQITYPFWVKGVFYGATLATCYEEAVKAFQKVVATWGLPVIVQAPVRGEELNVVVVGDGAGNLLGAVPMKKLLLTDKGKGWAGVTISDRQLFALTERFLRATRWCGPCELEIIRSSDNSYHLLEVNPRFPAWVYLAAAAGMNLPYAVAELALGRNPAPQRLYDVGKMFVRISLDQVTDMEQFDRIMTGGEIVYRETDESRAVSVRHDTEADGQVPSTTIVPPGNVGAASAA